MRLGIKDLQKRGTKTRLTNESLRAMMELIKKNREIKEQADRAQFLADKALRDELAKEC